MSLLLCLCDVFRVLINSLVCWNQQRNKGAFTMDLHRQWRSQTQITEGRWRWWTAPRKIICHRETVFKFITSKHEINKNSFETASFCEAAKRPNPSKMCQTDLPWFYFLIYRLLLLMLQNRWPRQPREIKGVEHMLNTHSSMKVIYLGENELQTCESFRRHLHA